MKTSKMRLSLTLIMALMVGTLTSEAVFAAGGGYGGWRGGGGWHGGGGWRGNGWGGGRVGIYLGAPIGFNFGYSPYPYYRTPYYGSPYYGSPYYYSPAPAYYPPAYPPVQPAPIIYTEQRNDPPIKTQEAPRTSQDIQESWWYYCVDAKAYYPYINKCPGGWLRVAPQPAPDSDDQPAVNNVPAP